MRVNFTILCLILALATQAQFQEYGGGIGFTSYAGDLVRKFPSATPSLGATAFYRMNFNEYFTVRLGLLVANIRGKEDPIDIFSERRNAEFSEMLSELSTVFEYHFLDFKSEKSHSNYSPYVMGGVSAIYYNAPTTKDISKFQLSIPIGVGFKYLIEKKYTLGFEVGARRTFYDYLDGVSGQDFRLKDYQYGNPNDTDWFFFSGFTLSITLFDTYCPFFIRPNQTILKR